MRWSTGALLLVIIGFSSPGFTARPLSLDPLWRDPDAYAEQPPAIEAQCRFAAMPIQDARDDLALVGVIDRRKLLAPRDRDAWLRSMLMGLNSRAIDLKLLSDSDGVMDNRNLAVLSLRSAWVDYHQRGFTSVVTFELSLGNGGSDGPKIIRGRATTTDFLGDIRSRAEGAFRKSVAQALDQIAEAMRASCR